MLGFNLTSDHRLFFKVPAESPFRLWMNLKGWQGQEIESLKLKQVHGKKIWAVEDLSGQKELEGDGVLLLGQGVPVVASLRFADCVPVVIACHGRAKWLLGLHSGFQGTLQNIVASGFEKVRELTGPVETQCLSAWIGPSIGACCYWRHLQGDSVTSRALKDFEAQGVTVVTEDRVFFDLRSQILHQLMCQGVARESIFTWPHCTACHPETYHSYRGGSLTERMTLFLSRS